METCVQSDRRVRRWGAEIVGAGEDVGFARVTCLGRPRDRCCSCSLDIVTLSSKDNAISLRRFSSQSIYDVLT